MRSPCLGRISAAPLSGAPDITIDLSGRTDATVGASVVLRPLYDGDTSEAAMIGALIGGRARRKSRSRTVRPGAIVSSRIASLEAADGLTGGMEAVFSARDGPHRSGDPRAGEIPYRARNAPR